VVPAIKPEDYLTKSRQRRTIKPKRFDDYVNNYKICIWIYEYVEDTNTGFNSTGERAPIDGVGEQI
jgi:hypothetical protein